MLKISLFLQKLLPKKNRDIFVGHPVNVNNANDVNVANDVNMTKLINDKTDLVTLLSLQN